MARVHEGPSATHRRQSAQDVAARQQSGESRTPHTRDEHREGLADQVS